jgi:ankyrin repeat protein
LLFVFRVESLSTVLANVEPSQRNLTDGEKSELRGICEPCFEDLEELKTTLKKFQGLDPDGDSNGLGDKLQRGWKKATWKQADVATARRRMKFYISLLNNFYGRLGRYFVRPVVLLAELTAHSKVAQETKEGVGQLLSREEHNAILAWLNAIDYTTQQSAYIERHQENTGDWLLNSAKFKNWVDRRDQTLFCVGIPGAGKTTIASVVVHRLCSKFLNCHDVGIAYLYCNYKRFEEQTRVKLLASLLKQLVQRQPTVPVLLKTLYDRGAPPSSQEISKMLLAVTKGYRKTYIIIDGLDECRSEDATRDDLLDHIFKLQERTGASLFTTSRFIPEIERRFQGCVSMEIRASEYDVRRYVEGKMRRLKPSIRQHPDLPEEIISGIVQEVDGMYVSIGSPKHRRSQLMRFRFLLAVLYIESLVGLTTPSGVRQKLESFKRESEGPERSTRDRNSMAPDKAYKEATDRINCRYSNSQELASKASTRDRNSIALDKAYKEAMDRINCQDSNSQELASKALSWIICAKRPLTARQLQHALAVKPGDDEVDKDDITEPEDIISVCAGLVTIDQESEIFQLVHYTTQEYFEKHRAFLFPAAESLIVQTCITYLSLGTFETGYCTTQKEFEERLQQYALYNYAASHWWNHDPRALKEAETLILELLKSEAKVSSCSQMIHMRSEYAGFIPPLRFTALHLTAYLGLSDIMMAFFDRRPEKPNIEAKDRYDSTPLIWAAQNGHVAAVKLLLENRANTEAHGRLGWTPLMWAARNGHLAVVKLLLETKADIEARDKHGYTPLICAAQCGHEEVVKLLLEHKAGIDSRGNYGSTALSEAATGGHLAVVKLLLDEKADVESRDWRGQTPLSWAAQKGTEAVVRLLLEREADVHSRDKRSRTALSLAAGRGNATIVNLLLENGSTIETEDDFRRTPLSWAAYCGNHAVVKLLLSRKAEIEQRDIDGRTPLLLAVGVGHVAVVKLLLDEKADVESKDDRGYTPLSLARRKGKEEVVTLLAFTAIEKHS